MKIPEKISGTEGRFQMEQYDIGLFTKGLMALNIELSDGQIRQFLRYYELLTEWNKVMNLTAITEYEEVVLRHFLDSLASVKVWNFQNTDRVIDVGCGAGFPGIPLKIAFPNIRLVLLDSLNKRIKFLDQVVEDLGLTQVKTIHGRAEDFARQKEYREQFDLCISRAVANLSTLSEYCLPYVKINGSFVAYKSGKIDEEVSAAKKAMKLLGAGPVQVVKFQLPDTDLNRSFVIMEKEKQTPKKFPRKAGMPGKEPII